MKEYSFIIPTFKRLDYLICAITSIKKLKNTADIEIIVIDDDSESDIYPKLQQKFGNDIIYLQHTENKGPGFSRREGFLKASGNFVIFMDDDDYYYQSNFLEIASDKFTQFSNVAFVSFNADNLYVKEQRITQENMLNRTGIVLGREFLEKFQTEIRKPKSTFTTVFRRTKLIEAGIGKMMMANDAAIFLRALLVGDAFLCDSIIGVYRIHETNITKTLSDAFIVENLNEKTNVFNNLPFGTFNNYRWLYNQSKASIIYFYSDNLGYKEDKNIINWVKQQNLFLRLLLFKDINITLSKRKIKHFIRGHNQ